MQAQWISIEKQLPAFDTVVMVTGKGAKAQGGVSDRVYSAARLVKSEDGQGNTVEVFADDTFRDALTFDVTHWQPIQALN